MTEALAWELLCADRRLCTVSSSTALPLSGWGLLVRDRRFAPAGTLSPVLNARLPVLALLYVRGQ